MGLAELLKVMDAAGVSLVQMQSYRPTTGKTYACTVGWFREGGSSWASSTANGPTQEAALEAAMRSTGKFEEFPVIRIEAPQRKRRSLEDIL